MTEPAGPVDAPYRVDAALLDRERDFLARRRRLNRTFALMYLPIAVGVVAMLVAKRVVPEATEAIAPAMCLSLAAAGLVFLASLRRWRCPACDKKFKIDEGWSSAHWIHCQHCGVRLRSSVTRARQEEEAFHRFGEADAEELRARLRRQRRLGGAGAAAALVLGIAAFAAGRGLGWGEQAPKYLGAAIGALVTAALMFSARCPRCQRGLLAGKDGHCPRCGLRAPRANTEAPAPAPSREAPD